MYCVVWLSWEYWVSCSGLIRCVELFTYLIAGCEGWWINIGDIQLSLKLLTCHWHVVGMTFCLKMFSNLAPNVTRNVVIKEMVQRHWVHACCCSFLAQQLGKDFERVAEAVLPSLIQLIPNSAKIMSTSATTAVRFIVRVSHSLVHRGRHADSLRIKSETHISLHCAPIKFLWEPLRVKFMK